MDQRKKSKETIKQLKGCEHGKLPIPVDRDSYWLSYSTIVLVGKKSYGFGDFCTFKWPCNTFNPKNHLHVEYISIALMMLYLG